MIPAGSTGKKLRAVVVAEGHHQLAVVKESSQEATTLSSGVANGGEVLGVASLAWLHQAIDVANTRQRHDPEQTDTAQRACTPVARHVNPSRCQG